MLYVCIYILLSATGFGGWVQWLIGFAGYIFSKICMYIWYNIVQFLRGNTLGSRLNSYTLTLNLIFLEKDCIVCVSFVNAIMCLNLTRKHKP